MKRLDIVVPVYNEEPAIDIFYQFLVEVLDPLKIEYRIIFVDDGSQDKTLDHLIDLSQQNERVTIIELSRNFGQQAAMSAGLSIADGDYIIIMDGDGQHPPSLIPEMLALAEQGYDIVLTRRTDQGNRWLSKTFYRLINYFGSTQIEPGGPDYRLLNANAALALRNMPEYHRFIRGMVAWIGFRKAIIPFTPAERISGVTKYSYKNLLRLALDAIFSFSLVPLYFAIMVGILFIILAMAEAGYTIFFWLTGHRSEMAPGWASLMFVLLFSGGSILLNIGIIGIYIGYIFQEVKQRPIFIIRSIHSSAKRPTSNS
jgi:dolichol-phosphate mannosyltransferase